MVLDALLQSIFLAPSCMQMTCLLPMDFSLFSLCVKHRFVICSMHVFLKSTSPAKSVQWTDKFCYLGVLFIYGNPIKVDVPTESFLCCM